MPTLVEFSGKDFDLIVWTNNLSASQNRQRKTLQHHDDQPVASKVIFSPAIQTKYDDSVKEHILDGPSFFENKQYDIELIFQDHFKDLFKEKPPEVNHRLRRIEDGFHYSKRTNSLRSNLNTQNDVGWFTLKINYLLGNQIKTQSISFEVLPTKMNLRSDMEAMNNLVDQTYPLWRYSLAESTEHGVSSKRAPRPEFLLMWLTQFKGLVDSLTIATKQVINAPHNQLVTVERSISIDRLKGARLTPKQEKLVRQAMASKTTNAKLRTKRMYSSLDTLENRFVKHVLKTSVSKLEKIKSTFVANLHIGGNSRLSDSFYTQLITWQAPSRRALRTPFFKEVGWFEGFSKESLVLQQKPGYSKVYRVWQELKWHLELLGDDALISQRNVAELYEIWCFLEIRRIILELDFNEIPRTNMRLNRGPLQVKIIDGMCGAFEFIRGDGIRVRLKHEPIFRKTSKPIRTWSITQKPDIVIEATLADGSEFVWVFDAKYRIEENQSRDVAPDDAINQMHRYRDALIHGISSDEGNPKKTRPVYGAFVLFPGFHDQMNSSNIYQESIEEIGIGAFCLLPSDGHNGSIWLRKFLEGRLGSSSKSYEIAKSDLYFVEDPARIPYRGTKIARHAGLTILFSGEVPGRSGGYTQRLMTGKLNAYHTKLLATGRQRLEEHIIGEVQYLGIATTLGAGSQSIERLYPVEKVQLVKRQTIAFEVSGTDQISDPNELYWLFTLGKSIETYSPITVNTPSHFTVSLTNFHHAFDGGSIEQLPKIYTSVLSG